MHARKRHKGRIAFGVVVVILLALAGYTYWCLRQPLPQLSANAHSLQIQTPTSANTIQWPGETEAALGIVGTEILQTHGSTGPKPTASTAKLITALTVLQKYPLQPGQQGPTITLGANDVRLYENYVALNGSVVPIASGEQLTEYQMLEAMMLPSANNIADSLAIWAYGSLPAYASAASQYLSQVGLTDTHIGSDASGLSPSTTSTAHDLVRVGELAMQNPVLAQIVGLQKATLPIAGTIKNVNFLLGQSNIVGIKTGNSDQAGGVFISASHATVNDRSVTVVTATVGTPDLFSAVQGSLPFIQTVQGNFATTTLLPAGSIVARYREPWGGSVAAVTQSNLNVTTWVGNTVKTDVELQPISPHARAGSIAGNAISEADALTDRVSVPVTLKSAPSTPSLWWRLLHP